ncbi:unnamed protein product [Ambrosiozyma monospora]|uniref:Unnamed protein product n=1 Tax=Ambrosiozyma monospora TaxID=43982 RepID=A0A9W6Z3D0_AMBMO|nr:unnamed protein product [Ambrosiozyma monospora]
MVAFPNMKGLATALPVTCYGASAMVFSTIAKTYFPGNTTTFLYSLVFIPLAISVVCGPLVCLMDKETHNHAYTPTAQVSKEYEFSKIALPLSQTSTPLSDSFSDSYDPNSSVLKTSNFWCLTVVLCICAGLSQMYIYSLGLIVTSLVADSEFIASNFVHYQSMIQHHQQTQVGLLSLASCCGRLLTGLTADTFYHFHMPTLLLLYIPALLVITSQIFGYLFDTINTIWLLSVFVGFGYGSIYSAGPIIVRELWGIEKFSFHWGLINMSPILCNVLFSSMFAKGYDQHTRVQKFSIDDDKVEVAVCNFKKYCYNGTYKITFFISLIPFVLVSVMIIKELLRRYSRRQYHQSKL